MKKQLVFLLFLLVSGVVSAQHGTSQAPPSTSVFGSNKHEKNRGNNSTIEIPWFSIKMTMTDFFRKEIGLKFEEAIFERCYLGFGWSRPLGHDYIGGFATSVTEKSGIYVDDIRIRSASLSDLYKDSEFESGNVFDFYFRYYPPSDNQKCLNYLEFSIKNKNCHYTFFNDIDKLSSGYEINSMYYTLYYGHSWIVNINNYKFIHELSYGAGCRYAKWDNFVKQTDFGKETLSKDGTQSSFIAPFLTFKYNIGLGR